MVCAKNHKLTYNNIEKTSSIFYNYDLPGIFNYTVGIISAG